MQSKYNRQAKFASGAQCNEEIIENIVWSRTPALNNISVPCPGDALMKSGSINKTGKLNRSVIHCSTNVESTLEKYITFDQRTYDVGSTPSLLKYIASALARRIQC